MKKNHKSFVAVFLIACTLSMSSCATVFGGHVNAYQQTKPKEGELKRPLRVGALIADIVLFAPGLIVDFATCAIYKPYPYQVPAQPEKPATPASSAK